MWSEKYPAGRKEAGQVAIELTKKQACQFILLKQGLIGRYRFVREEGVLQFIRQAGCIQYDPIDVCGKNAELVLQSRVKGFTKQMLGRLLYKDRKLVDYFDKNLSILPVENWACYARTRERYRKDIRSQEAIDTVSAQILQIIEEKGPVCSRDLAFDEKVDWSWNDTRLSRAALEAMYFRGDLAIHHKTGTVKYYALAKDCIPEQLLTADDPCPDDIDHFKWRVRNRISAVGLMWNRASDAWLGIKNLKSAARDRVFASLLEEQGLLEIHVDGIKDPFYCLAEDKPLLERVCRRGCRPKARMELIAPLDNMLWDRKLIEALFGFSYKWEIYTPVAQRKYGYYVLPILYGHRLIGRTEVVCDRKNDALVVRAVWPEPGVKATETLLRLLDDCFIRFMNFHRLGRLIRQDR